MIGFKTLANVLLYILKFETAELYSKKTVFLVWLFQTITELHSTINQLREDMKK